MHNILVNTETQSLQIIDWGLSEYYQMNCPYNLKVSTKFYKAPELILGYQYYDYSLDIWWIAILFAELLLNKFPLINWQDSKDQLYKLIKLLGYKEFKKFTTTYNIKNPFEIKETLKKWEPIDFRTLFPEEREEFIDDQALDLLKNIFRFDKQERLTAKEALEHPYFIGVEELL
jgi:casein kinase II subunit alpha